MKSENYETLNQVQGDKIVGAAQSQGKGIGKGVDKKVSNGYVNN
jgi:hypothetical protein